MMTSFTRIIIVLSLLRSALGTQNSPPNQVLIVLALFMTFFIMSPVIDDIYKNAYEPLAANKISTTAAIDRAAEPLKAFMTKQTREADLALFVKMSKSNEVFDVSNIAEGDITWTTERNSVSKLEFSLIKDKLEIGFENSAWLRYASDVLDFDKEIFDRNPYVTVDSLVKRLTGYADKNWVWLPTGSLRTLNNIDILVHADKKISITNNNARTLLIRANSFHEIKSDNSRSRFGSQSLVYNGATVDFQIVGNNDSWFLNLKLLSLF
jgi:hypothetical protein